MDNNLFGKTQENDYDNNQSVSETQGEQQSFGNMTGTSVENTETQTTSTGQYYSGSTPQYSGDAQTVQNPYSYESISSQNPYSYDDQNNQNTYTSASYDTQNTYSYNNTNSQNAYSYNNQNTYGNQDAQNAQNTQNTYSYGYQNTQNGQNPYSYAGQNNQGQVNYNNPYVASYGQNQTGYQPELEEPVKMGDWLLLQCLLSFIPCVGLILAIVWAFSKTEKQSKVNFCRAYLIVALIQLALAFIFIVIYGSVILAAWDAF